MADAVQFRERRCHAVVVTHKRPELLQHTLQCVARSSDIDLVVIVQNHPESLEGVTLPGGPAYQLVQSGRPPEHLGNLSQSWNLGWLWAWRDPTTEWVLCLQDDVHLEVGWVDRIRSKPPYHLYMAPAGDQIFLLDRECFRRAGWFDERFTTIGFHEWDWTARAIRALGAPCVCLEDGHGWKHNPIGLPEMWQPASVRPGKSEQYIGINEALLGQKWGRGRNDMVGMIGSGTIPEPLIPEVEWYPWFAR